MDRKTQNPETLTVLYDGACPLCQREIAHVRRLAEKQGAHDVNTAANSCGLNFLDISDASTPCSSDERAQLLARFHVQKPDGSRLSGAEAFVAMWERLPGWRWLARIARLPGMLPVFEVAYRVFLKLRPGMQAAARKLERISAR